MSYRDRFYKSYASTNIIPREGRATLEEFKTRAIIYQKQFGKLLPIEKSSRIIDLGCGNGSIVWWLQQSGFTNVEGIDTSFEQVGLARKLGVKNITQADIRGFLKDIEGLYDVVFLRDVIEHFNKEELTEILDICYASLKNGGTAIIQTVNAESPFGARVRYFDFTHEIAFTASSLSQMLRVVGFCKVEFYSTETPICGVVSFVRFVLWKFIEAFYKLLLFIEIGSGTKVVTQGIIAVARKGVP